MRSRLPLFSRDSFIIPTTRPQAVNTANRRLKRGPMMRKSRHGKSGATKNGVPDPGPVGAIKKDPSTAKRSIPWANTNDCRPAVGVKVRRLCDLITETTNQQHASGTRSSSSTMKIGKMGSITSPPTPDATRHLGHHRKQSRSVVVNNLPATFQARRFHQPATSEDLALNWPQANEPLSRGPTQSPGFPPDQPRQLRPGH